MEKYDNYKDSGIEWIGEIPEHWEKYRLGIIGKFSSSGIDKKLVDNEPKVKIINYTDIYGNGNSILDSSKDYMIVTTPQSKIDEHSVNKGDLIFTPSSETKEDIGLSALVIEDLENTAFSYHVLRFQFTRPVDLNFKKYICNNYYVLSHFSKNSQGTTRQTLGRNDFKTAEIILPTPEEQTAIASYLDRKTAEIDELIADKKRLLELYEEEKTAIINELVTGEKVWNGNAWTEPAEVKDSGIEWLGEIPEHWEVKKVKHVLKSLNSVRVPLSADERGKMVIREYDYYGASGVIDRVEDYLFDEPLLLIGEDGANLVTRSTRLSFIARGKYWVNNHAHILKPTFGLLEYYCELMELCDYSIWISGSAQPKLTSENLMNIQIIVPPFDEQKSIMNYLETKCALIDAKKAKTEKLIELLTEYRTALISEVVTGKIKVTL